MAIGQSGSQGEPTAGNTGSELQNVPISRENINAIANFATNTIGEIEKQRKLLNWVTAIVMTGFIVLLVTVAGLIAAYIWGQTQTLQQGFRDMNSLDSSIKEDLNKINQRIDESGTQTNPNPVN